MRINPSRAWYKAAKRSFLLHRSNPASRHPQQVFLLGLYRQGYTARQAGKLIAFLARCEEQGDKLEAFDWYNVGFLECAPYV